MFAPSTTAARALIGSFGTLVCAGICLLGATAPAAAAEPVRTVTIDYADLDLAHDGGRDALDSRIKAAARKVCSDGSRDLRSRTEETRCVRTAIEGAQTQKMAAMADFKG